MMLLYLYAATQAKHVSWAKLSQNFLGLSQVVSLTLHENFQLCQKINLYQLLKNGKFKIS
jgi:hypothetical protein